MLSAVINSLYSFYWDTTHDWGFNLLRTGGSHMTSGSIALDRSPSSHTHFRGSPLPPLEAGHIQVSLGLRRVLLLFPSPIPYYLAILCNLVLRLTWSLKLSPHLHDVALREYSVFLIEGLEIARRWLWVYLRVEWECVKRSTSDHHSPESIELVGDTS